MVTTLELGVDTFGDITADGAGDLLSPAQVIRNVVEEGVVADQVGLDFFGVGEHHRADFSVSAPEVVLAAIAARTERIHLGSAVTVLSSDDPVRVYQRFATVDAISGGRAEVILGRGSFTESFPLFGYPLDRYEELFEDKIELFARLRAEGPIDWEGTLPAGVGRAAIHGLEVHPKTESGGLTTWVGVGGSPESVVRAAHYELPLTLAIIGGDSARFRPYVDLYHRALDEFGHERLPIAVHSPGHVAATDEQAREELWPHFKANRDRIGAERGWGPLTRVEYDRMAGPGGSLYVGSPETVARKIVETAKVLGNARFDLKYGAGALSHEAQLQTIELLGTKVRPIVDELLAAEPALAGSVS